MENFHTQQVKMGTTEHLPLQKFEAVDMPLGDAIHPESGSKSLIHLSTGGQPQGFQLFQQAVAHPCPGLDEIRQPFSKHLPLAAGLAAKELAHTEPQDDATAPARHIVDGALILTVDMV